MKLKLLKPDSCCKNFSINHVTKKRSLSNSGMSIIQVHRRNPRITYPHHTQISNGSQDFSLFQNICPL